ncbi:MAG: xylulokinase [Clostridia bacterium]|nr:xylulokinase [Clostridia bacterium]
MSYYVGIDLGTSSVKTLLLSDDGQVISSITKEYPLYFPHSGWSEQNPEDWYNQTLSALKELFRDIDTKKVRSFSFSGQMHGLVTLDSEDNVIRPALLWNDSRSQAQTDALNEDKGFLLDNTANIAFAGFTLPKLLWVKENEPENYAKISKIMLPKDYVAYRLSGAFCTDVSDASGTLYFDVQNRSWAKKILDAHGIKEEWLPRVLESDECAGMLKADLADELGLGEVKIIIGAGDNAAAAIGTGTVKDGDCNISLGTSGTIFTVSDKFSLDRESAIHSFCSASRNYHQMACMLSAAVCCNWWVEKVLRDGYDSVNVKTNRLGENEVMFLPYLMGERSPLNDTDIRGLFCGMSLDTDKDDMSLAVLEGVAFALRHNIDIIKNMGINIKKSNVCGGGTKNKLWLKIIANVLGIELMIPENQEGASLGAALLAAKGVMTAYEYRKLESKVYKIAETVASEKELSEKYEEKYLKWRKLYPAIKGIN